MENGNAKAIGLATTASLSFCFYFIPAGSLFQQFMPRSVCMFHEPRLIIMHGIDDALIFIAYIIISISLFGAFRIVKEKNIPLQGFLWMFGIFIFFCGLTHAMGVLNLYVTFYWLDGAIKTVCAIFSLLTAFKFVAVPGILKDMYTGEEYRQLMLKNKELEERLTKLEKK